jgi:chemotaxis protein methyltransferase WspC
MGHAEPLSHDLRFQRAGPDGFFLYTRASAAVARRESTPEPACLAAEKPKAKSQKPGAKNQEPKAGDSPGADADLLRRARAQADAGHLAEALALCHRHLARAGPSADLFSLMGILHGAKRQQQEALLFFQKALYLKPDHEEALLHLSILHEERGERQQAAALRGRLARLTSLGET